jgi:hypothetical protein
MTLSIVSNPAVAPDFTRARPRLIEAGDAIALLTDRQFHVCGENMRGEVPFLQERAAGAFLVGAKAPKYLAEIRRANPHIPLITEPVALKEYWATPLAPFLLEGDPSSLFAMSLSATLDWQRMNGSDLAITPTGQIRVGDSASLKAALAEANALDRSDMLFALPMEAGWLSEAQHLKQLITVINRSRHPVLLMFTSKTNPVESGKRLRAYRHLFTQVTVPVIAYRTDLVGFDALAHGALASAIGSYPSIRRLNPVGQHGFAMDREDLSPHMFVEDMLRFVRSTHMRRDWFAGASAIQCFCVVCRGQEIDRLHGSNAERAIGHLHNVVAIDSLYSMYVGLDGAARHALWSAQTAGALDTYPQLESHIGRPVKIPADLVVWAA